MKRSLIIDKEACSPAGPGQIFDLLFSKRGWEPFAFQQEMLNEYLKGSSGLLNAPTGSGKTLAAGLPVLIEGLLRQNAIGGRSGGLQALWITPVRALAAEIETALNAAARDIGLDWRIENRTGDTSAKDRARQTKNPPEVLITTPESLHILFTRQGYEQYFSSLRSVVVDEWHELLGSKRGVQVELALSRLRTISPELRVWGISATIGNMREAADVLIPRKSDPKIIKAGIEKRMEVVTLMPDEVERYPWAGHLGLHLIGKAVEVIDGSASTLLFTNTRGQAEIWYQALLDKRPDWAGLMALHHGSLSAETRTWVENALHEGRLKLVVCTSSLDLGVDFRPVETVIQVGSPKGVARFAQRAGRSGHQPGAVSRIYLLPTHALELVEAAGLKEALKARLFETRPPVVRAFDVLVQYLVTLAVGGGFQPSEILKEVTSTNCYSSLTGEEWSSVLKFITTGGDSLKAYEEFARVRIDDGRFLVDDRRTAMRHRLSVGTIPSETSLTVVMSGGRRLGNIEEYFISRLHRGDVFVFGGQLLELVSVRGTQVLVKKATVRSRVVPSWNGGRMPLSSQISRVIRSKLSAYKDGDVTDEEVQKLIPLLERQRECSALPGEDELLIEVYKSGEGTHIFLFPFEGRMVHEGMAMLFAYRLSLISPSTFNLGMNDYGLELLTDNDFDFIEYLDNRLFSTENLMDDIFACTNYAEIARRRFRDIAAIAGLLFKGFPKRQVKTRHLQADASLFYEVFKEYDKNNFLLMQALDEALLYQLEETRMREALLRMQKQQKVVVKLDRPSPFSFPILVDSLREKMTNESLEDRVRRMIRQMEEA